MRAGEPCPLVRQHNANPLGALAGLSFDPLCDLGVTGTKQREGVGKN